MPLSTEVGLGPGDIELDGDPAPSKKRAQTPIFSTWLLWQTAEWIKIPLDMEVGLSAGDFVLNGDPASPQKGAE